MTIALGNDSGEMVKVVKEYVDTFDYKPLELVAGKIGMYVQRDEKWEHFLSVNIGEVE